MTSALLPTASRLLRWTAPLVLVGAVVGAPVPQEVEDDLYFECEQLGWDLTEKHKVPGVAIARVQGGKILWSLGCGFADMETEEPVTGETVFNIGSISKSVAAWGYMKLVEEGKFDLDKPAESYLKSWKLPESKFDSKEVTLRGLLSHTAGLSLHGYPGFDLGVELPTTKGSLDGETNGPGRVELIMKPGTEWRYSGGGFTIAQLMLEEATGQDFATYMREQVMMPLGMASADYGWTDKVKAMQAKPYDYSGKLVSGPCFRALAAAGLQLSAEDLGRFAIANMPKFLADDAKTVLKPETIASMHETLPASDRYGLGFQLETVNGILEVGHGGANEGWMALMTFAPELGDGIVILTNSTRGQRLHDPIKKAWRNALVKK